MFVCCMIECWEWIEVVDMVECCVLRDCLEIFLFGVCLVFNGEVKFVGLCFCSIFFFLGENCVDLSDVGVFICEFGWDII